MPIVTTTTKERKKERKKDDFIKIAVNCSYGNAITSSKYIVQNNVHI